MVLSSNESFARIAIQRGGKRPEDVFVVRNGPDPNVFRPVEPDLDVRRGKRFLLGYVGVMGAQDGVLDLIHALAELRRWRSDWHTILVGTGDVVAPAQRLSDELGLAGDIDFLGHVSDRQRLVQLIASCDLCLSPEPGNALNQQSTLIKVAEYMAVGKPVVAFDLAETRATAGPSAAYATAPGPAAYAREIDALLDDPLRRRDMGGLGRRRVLAELSWTYSERHLLDAYDRALARAMSRTAAG